jgi:hypothetical protein
VQRARPASIALAVLLLAPLLLTACGSSETAKRRQAVNKYLERVDRAELTLLGRKGQIDTVLQHFSLTTATPAEVHGLLDARSLVSATVERVRTIEAPPDVRRLRAALVQQLELQLEVTDELLGSTRYIPQFAAAVLPLRAAAASLSRDLASVKPSGKARLGAKGVPPRAAGGVFRKYAAAFAAYRLAIQAVAERLHRLTAPALLRPGLLTERRALDRNISLCKTIEHALLTHDITAANAGIHALFSAASGGNSTQSLRAQADAARAYNDRLRQIAKLTAKVASERERLVKEIG